MKMIQLKKTFLLLGCGWLAVSLAWSGTHLGAGGYLEWNGARVFPIGAYALPKGMNFTEAESVGFNLVHARADQAAWDQAGEAGLWVWHSFGEALDLTGEKAESRRQAVRETVEKLAGHPRLLFWESVDEPAWTDGAPAVARNQPEGLIAGRRFLRELDPAHPVYLNHAPRNTVETLRRYNPACDIVCVDIYPIIPPGLRPMYAITPDGRHGDLPNQTPSCVGEYVDKMRRVAGEGRSVFVVLQGFAWEALREKDMNTAQVRYPNARECRFMAWQSIIHGARGLMIWGLHTVPKEHPFIQDWALTLCEIRELTPVILGEEWPNPPVLRYHERGSSITAGIEVMGRETDDAYYLVAANTSLDPAAADFLALPSDVPAWEVLGEKRAVSVNNGLFLDEFEGLAVHIYRALKAKP